MKDYYKILDIRPAASLLEIRKSYRTLAFRYHPDKNPGNQLSEAHFKEIQEAYSVLSNSTRRAMYDDGRWLAGSEAKNAQVVAITPQWLVKVSLELTASLASMDTYRLSKRALQAYILLILSDIHIDILRLYNQAEVNRVIITELLKAAAKLNVRYLDEIEERLILLAGDDDDMLQAIDDKIEERKRTVLMEKMLPYFVIAVTLGLCFMMYLYGTP